RLLGAILQNWYLWTLTQTSFKEFQGPFMGKNRRQFALW
ncbi:hypothetical protein DBR06_SOUSAS110223, partial [Sousa chinensis]